jgi:single-strand DNA-binding protein
MNETYVTLRGWIGGDVRHRLAGDSPVAEFRLGVTPRYFDAKRSEWVDGAPQWYTIKAWRQLADNCRDSLRRSDPVLVHGRLTQRSYVNANNVEVTVLEVTASSVGHDLTMGTGQFRRTVVKREQPERREEVVAGTAAA